jgi:iron complex outermembrane receptor protein
MRPEKMSNVEVGFNMRSGRSQFSVNGFLQSMTDEIVPGGGIDEDGNAIRANAGKSVHRGIEMEAGFNATPGIDLNANLTLTDNYFKQYIEKFDPLNPVDYSGNTISSFPGIIGNAAIAVRAPMNQNESVVFLGGASVRHVGKIYLDNSQAEDLTTGAYTVIDVRAGLKFGLGNRAVELEAMVYNATNQLYSTFGYTWGSTAYLWPAAERNYFVRLRTGW